MTTALDKFIKYKSPKEKDKILLLLKKVLSGDWIDLDIKRLSGEKNRNIYRVRMGKIRLIVEKDGKQIFLLEIEQRSDTTYSRY